MERYLNMKFKNLIGFCVARVSKLHGFVADFYKTSYFYYGKFSAKFLYFLVRQIFQNVTVSSKSSVPTHGLFKLQSTVHTRNATVCLDTGKVLEIDCTYLS